MSFPQASLWAGALLFPLALDAAPAQLLGWNNLGMHCMDSDYSVFSVLPPYNTIEAQLIVSGKLVRDGGSYGITYQAVADPGGSLNSTAMGKGNFYSFSAPLYGAELAPESGLAGWAMPGLTNVPQAMRFEATNQPAAGVSTPVNWWRAEGIPISPYDDAGRKNPYPLMRLIAWSATGQPLATNDVVLPVSDEMDCRACHASGTQAAAQPSAGWVWNGLPERDYRLNILRLHDERQFARDAAFYAEALAARHFNPQGLYRGVLADARPVLCAACHASEALGAPSYKSIPPLTASVHAFHAHVIDPVAQVSLDEAANRAACYRCHPGSATRCLRGAMGGAVAADGSMEIQCQSCHGSMSAVGSTNRVGWFMEPNCQSCHTGTATGNNGQIRYASAFAAGGAVRVPVNRTFATQPDTPAPGLSLYRFSAGHGGLQCSACHGSTHAEFPSTHANDNLRNLGIQGHIGMVVECGSCHTTVPNTVNGGPHGLHPVGSVWVSRHPDLLESGQASRSQCQGCHGSDYRGTVLSRAQADRSLNAFGSRNFFRGALIGCYSCHNGPDGESANNSTPPSVTAVATNTLSGAPVSMTVGVTPAGAVLRIISQAVHGSVGLSNRVITYFPGPGFAGSDTFTYAAWDGAKNSALTTGTVEVKPGPASLSISARVPASYPSGWPVPFGAEALASFTTSIVLFDWDFGDGAPHGTNQFVSHTYATPGTYSWQLTATSGSARAQASGTVQADKAVALEAARVSGGVAVSWPRTAADPILERSAGLGAASLWLSVTNPVTASQERLSVIQPVDERAYYRLRQSW